MHRELKLLCVNKWDRHIIFRRQNFTSLFPFSGSNILSTSSSFYPLFIFCDMLCPDCSFLLFQYVISSSTIINLHFSPGKGQFVMESIPSCRKTSHVLSYQGCKRQSGIRNIVPKAGKIVRVPAPTFRSSIKRPCYTTVSSMQKPITDLCRLPCCWLLWAKVRWFCGFSCGIVYLSGS